jgi:hypothetical protein
MQVKQYTIFVIAMISQVFYAKFKQILGHIKVQEGLGTAKPVQGSILISIQIGIRSVDFTCCRASASNKPYSAFVTYKRYVFGN